MRKKARASRPKNSPWHTTANRKAKKNPQRVFRCCEERRLMP
jgi:hypothetical protein